MRLGLACVLACVGSEHCPLLPDGCGECSGGHDLLLQLEDALGKERASN